TCGRNVERASGAEYVDDGRITVVPERGRIGDRIEVTGSGWADCPIELSIDGERVTPWKVILGFPTGRAFRPDGSGEFVVQVATFALEPGKIRVSATQRICVERKPAVAEVELVPRPMLQDPADGGAEDEDEGAEDNDLAYFRTREFLTRRFRRAGFIPP